MSRANRTPQIPDIMRAGAFTPSECDNVARVAMELRISAGTLLPVARALLASGSRVSVPGLMREWHALVA